MQNLVQNPRTMLPKFFGLYCVRSKGKNIRIVVMNNLIPSQMQVNVENFCTLMCCALAVMNSDSA